MFDVGHHDDNCKWISNRHWQEEQRPYMLIGNDIQYLQVHYYLKPTIDVPISSIGVGNRREGHHNRTRYCPTPLLESETRNCSHRATCVTLTNSSPNASEISAMVLQVKLWLPLNHLVTSDGLR